MIVYECDHCGKVTMNVYKTSIKYNIATTDTEDKDFHIFYGHLCEKCLNVLTNFCSYIINKVSKNGGIEK